MSTSTKTTRCFLLELLDRGSHSFCSEPAHSLVLSRCSESGFKHFPTVPTICLSVKQLTCSCDAHMFDPCYPHNTVTNKSCRLELQRQTQLGLRQCKLILLPHTITPCQWLDNWLGMSISTKSLLFLNRSPN